jgi:tripartite-type tricarboxylate transporter receptor subunit TctC
MIDFDGAGNGAILAMVRPESIKIVAAEGAGLKGQIDGVSFVGDRQRATISGAAAPDIPTTDEAGLPGFYIAVWHGLWVPKGTPKEIVTKLNAAVRDTLADSAVRQRLAALSLEIPSLDQHTPEGLYAHQKAEIEKWWPIIKGANLKGE